MQESLPPNAAWWREGICCTLIEEVSERGEDTANEIFFGLRQTSGVKWTKLTNHKFTNGPGELWAEHLDRKIEAVTENRQIYFWFQPENWPTYHSWTILEVGNSEFFISCERKADKLEMMYGQGQIAYSIMKDIRPTGTIRNLNLCSEEPRQRLASGVTVRKFLEWVDTTLAERWTNYSLLQSNCQHLSREVLEFLVDPRSRALKALPTNDREAAIAAVKKDARALRSAPEKLRCDREFVIAALSPNWNVLRYASPEIWGVPEVILAGVKENVHALQYSSEELRADKAFMRSAIEINGHALQYANRKLHGDQELVLAAIEQNGYALQYASKKLREDRDFVLDGVRKNGHALAVTSREFQKDREIVLAAVEQDRQTFNYVRGELRNDMEVRVTYWKCPSQVRCFLTACPTTPGVCKASK